MKIENVGIIHASAYCEVCDFSIFLNLGETKGLDKFRRCLKNHVQKTGHKVIVEETKMKEYGKE